MAIQNKKNTLALSGIVRNASISLAELFAKTGFDPGATGSGWVMLITDSHMANDIVGHPYRTTAFSDSLHRALRGAALLVPDAVVHIGDMLTDFVPAFGQAPGTGYLHNGMPEVAWFNAEMSGVLQRIAPTYLSLGNHDTPPMETAGLGAFCMEHMTGFDKLHHSFHCGGVQWQVLSADHGAGFVDGQFDAVDAAFAANNGEDMVLTVHQGGAGRSHDWHAMLDMWGHIPDGLPGHLLFLHGHIHMNTLQKQRKPGGKLVERLTFGAAIPEAHATGNAVSPTLGAVACRDGKIVERYACDCASGIWYRLKPFTAVDETPAVWDYYAPLAGETRTIDYRGDGDLKQYCLEGVGGPRYYDTGTWFSYINDLRVGFPSATGTRVYIMSNKQPTAVRASTDGNSWLDVTFESFGDQCAVFGLPSETQNLATLYLSIDMSGGHLSGWGILE